MKTESLCDLQLAAAPSGLTPRLRAHLRSLEQALAADRGEQARRELRAALVELLHIFTGATAGLVRRLESSRPELAALASNLDSAVHFERLLRFSMSVLRGLDHPAQASLLSVFFQPPTNPLPHARWLQLGGSADTSTMPLSMWLDSPGTDARADVRAYLPLLNHWLKASSGFLGLFAPVVRQQRLVAFEASALTFELLPAVAWEPLPDPGVPEEVALRPAAYRPNGEDRPRLELDFELPDFDFVAPDPFEKEALESDSLEAVLDKTLSRSSEQRLLPAGRGPNAPGRVRPRPDHDLTVPGTIEVDLQDEEISLPAAPADFRSLEPQKASPLVELEDWYRETPESASELSPRLIPSKALDEEVSDLLAWYGEEEPAPSAPRRPAAPAPAPPAAVGSGQARKRIVLPSKDFVTGVRARDRKNGLGGFGRGVYKVWSPEQVDSVRAAVERACPPLAPGLRPDFLVAEVAEFVSRLSCGYLLVQGPQGTGKSLLTHSLGPGLESVLPVITFPIRANLQGDFQTFIEVLDEHLRVDEGALRANLRPLGHRVTRELNIRYPGAQCAERFTAYLSQLALLNGTRYLLALDGLDEIFEGAESHVLLSDFLPETPPEGVYLVLTYREDGCPSRTARKLGRLQAGGAETLYLDVTAPAYRQLVEAHLNTLPSPPGVPRERIVDQARGRLAFARHLVEGLRCGLFTANDLPGPDELYDRVLEGLERRAGERLLKLFLLCATSYDPVHVEELSSLGIDSGVVIDILGAMPSLFRYSRELHACGLFLAHEAFRQHLQENYAGRYSQACERLAGRAARELLAVVEPGQSEFNIAPEGLRSRFDRLYRWLLDSQNAELMYRAAASFELRKLREEVCARLEEQGRFHHKLSILDGFKECLAVLVGKLGRADLREDLAWAHNSRGLTYLKGGQFTRCLEEIERAVLHFRVLVDLEGQEELRNGLAAAFNRRSEALRYLGRHSAALESAELAVSEYYLVVVRLGRAELRYLLALALVNRGVTYRHVGELNRARNDLDGAIELYSELVFGEGQRQRCRLLAEAQHARASLALLAGDPAQAAQDCTSALGLLQHLPEDVRNERAAVDTDRGAALHRLGQLPEARDAYNQAISLRTELISEGRLDLRGELAASLTHRGLVLSQLGEELAALEDHTRSLAYRSRLIEVEGQHELRLARAFTYLCRGASLSGLGRRREALQDYEKAIDDYVYSAGTQELSPAALGELASAYCCAGVLHLELKEYEQAVDRCSHALELLSEAPAELALARNNRGEAYRHLGEGEAAHEDFSAAIALYGELVGEREELISALGQSHLNRAAVAQALGDFEQAAKDCQRAVRLFESALERHPEPALRMRLGRAFALRGLAHLALEAYDSALEDVTRGLAEFEACDDSGEELARALIDRAQVLAALGQHERAVDDYQGAVERLERLRGKGPEISRALLLRCRSLLKLTDSAGATQDVLRAYRLTPALFGAEEMANLHNLIMTLKQQGGRLLREGSRAAAVEAYDQAVELCGALVADGQHALEAELAEALNYRGWARTLGQDLEGALTDFGRSIDLYRALHDAPATPGRKGSSELAAGSLAGVHNHRGVTLDRAGRALEAEQDYTAAIELYRAATGRLELRAPLATSWANRGLLHLRQGREAQATADLGEAISIRRVLAREDKRVDQLDLLAGTLMSRAGAHEVLGQIPEAIADYQEATGYLFRLVDELRRTERRADLCRCLLEQARLEGSTAGRTLAQAALTLGRLALEGMPVSASELAAVLAGTRLQAPAPELVEAVLTLGRQLLQVPCAAGWGRAPDLWLALSQWSPPRQADLLVLASAYCAEEVKLYGRASLPRLLHCLHALGTALRHCPPPAFLSLVGPAFSVLVQSLEGFEAGDGLNRDINNTAKVWQALPGALVAQTGTRKGLFTELRRW